MPPIGFSTGSLAQGDFLAALSMMADSKSKAVELSALREDELMPLLEALPGLDLRKYSYRSFHAPSIVMLARGLKKRLEPEQLQAVEEHRLLIVTPFPSSVRRATRETASRRNELMADFAAEIFVAYAQPGGSLQKLVVKYLERGRRVFTLDVPENRELIDAGVLVR